MIYLDNAATGKFKPQCVLDAVWQELSDGANPGRAAHDHAMRSSYKIFEARDAVRKLFFAHSGNVVFTKNCTEALNLALFGLFANQKKTSLPHIVTTSNEHNSMLRPLYLLKKQKKITLSIVAPQSIGGAVLANDIAAACNNKTALIAINHISNVTGAKACLASIGEIARAKKVLFLVDAAQSAGHTQVDMQNMNINMLAAPGHKGLSGPQGTGFFVFDDIVADSLAPIVFGGTGTLSHSLSQGNTIPEDFESGTLNTPGIAGLHQGIEWTYQNSHAITRKLTYLTSLLIDGLKKIQSVTLYTLPDSLNGVVSFKINGISPTQTANILNQEHLIAVRAGQHCAPLAHKTLGTNQHGAVRASIGWNNTQDCIEAFLDAIKIQKQLVN